MKVPHPTKPGVFISRQSRWQLQQQAKGLCMWGCGRPLVTKRHCREHADKQAACWRTWYRNLRQAALLAVKET